MLGNKTKGGFYKKQKAEAGDKPEIWTLETASLEYRPAQKVKLPALDMAKNIEDTGERIKVWCGVKIASAAFLWKTLSRHSRTRRIGFRRLLTPLWKSIARCAGALVGSWVHLKFGMRSALRSRSRG